MDVVDLLAALEFVHHIIYKFQVLVDQITFADLGLFSEVDKFAVQAVTCRAPFVFHYE